MTEAKRDYLRRLQDRWLNVRSVASQIHNYGEDETITGQRTAPTFRQVRTLVLPEWEGFFAEFLDGQ